MPKFSEPRSPPSGVQGRPVALGTAKTNFPLTKEDSQGAARFAVGQAGDDIVLFGKAAVAVINQKPAAGTGPLHLLAIRHDMLRGYDGNLAAGVREYVSRNVGYCGATARTGETR